MAHEITAIRMAPGGTLHQHITDYRWRNRGGGNSGASNKATMVDFIDRKGGVVYVGSGTGQARVGTVHESGVQPYLRTYADGVYSNNLLALPRF